MEYTNTFRILFYVKKTKTLKNGQALIFMRITINGERAEVSTHRSVDETLWDQKKEKVKESTSEANKLNEDLAGMQDRVRRIKRQIEEDEMVPTADVIRYRYQNKGLSQKTLVGLYSEPNIQYREKIGNGISAATVEKYERVLKFLIEFIKATYHMSDYPLKAVNHKFIKDFEHYLRTMLGCNNNSRGKYLRNFKTIIRIAISNDWIR